MLLLLNFTIIYGSEFLNPMISPTVSTESQLHSRNSFFNVERDIRPIDYKFSGSPQPVFRPSPLITNNISADLSFSEKEQEQPIIVNIDLERSVISLGDSLKYVIQATCGFNPVPDETFNLTIISGEYWGWYYWLDSYSPIEDRIIETKKITTGSNGEYHDSFNPPSSGRYSIVIYSIPGESVPSGYNTSLKKVYRPSYEYVYETRSFTVADIGLFWRVSSEFVKGTPHYSVAYVVNTTDFSPIFDAEIELFGVTYDYNYQTYEYEIHKELLFSGVSNDQGIIDITFKPPESITNSYSFLANLTAKYNGEEVYVSRDIYRGGYYWGWNSYSEFKPYEFVVTTDKPIYSPGESIQTRFLLWKNDYLKVTKEPVQDSFSLKILSPSQHVLLNHQVNTNSYGVATFSFSLDTDCELGTYSIITQKEETVSSYEIRVDKYEKPSFRVYITLDRDYVPPGELVSGNVSAEYYFGKPVSDSEIEVAIGNLDVLTGITDMDGYWEFEYRLPSEEALYGQSGIPINVTVIDTVGRKVTNSAMIQIADEVYTWAYVNPWFPKVGENITIYFGAYQYSDEYWYWSPLADADVLISLYGILPDRDGLPQLVQTIISETDENGYGQVELELEDLVTSSFTRFEGTIEVDAGDGRKGTSTFYFTIDTTSVEATLNTDNYKAGDTVEIEINIRNVLSNISIDGNIQLSIFDSDYDLIAQDTEKISSEGKVIDFNLSTLAPNGEYTIYFYLETTFDYEYGSWTYYSYSDTVKFYVGPTHQISLTKDKNSYSLGDNLTISGQIEGQTNVPVMLQFVKKGIVVTEYIDISEILDFTVQIEDIGFLAPHFWVYLFVILNDGTILETSIDIEIETTLLVEIQSDKSIYKPGDAAKIGIEVFDSKQQPLSAVLAVSFIDSSVFGVEPDPEIEQQHFENQEYWPSVWTVVSWKSQQQYWWFWWYEDYYILGARYSSIYFNEPVYGRGEPEATWDQVIPPPSSPEKAGEDDLSQDKQKIRDYLPENAYWSPLVIAEDGKWEMKLTLPDTIGEWTVRVVATSPSGQGTLSKSSFKTFLPFFVEIEKEPYVLQDDVFVLKGIVYNYLEELVNISLEIETDTGILLLGRDTQKLSLPSGFLGSISWACLAQDVGFFNTTLYASTTLSNGTSYTDAIRKALEIIPNGIALEFKAGGFVSSEPSFSYLRYSEAIQQSEYIELSLGLGSIALTSWERLITYPYGCTEQTISSLIPDALVLEYLNETNQLTNETEELILDMIVSGLSRIYSLRHKDGGWGWWQADSSQVYMTSLVLYGLGVIKNCGIFIEPSIVSEALSMLNSRQNYEGSWTPDSWDSIDQVSFTAFVLRAILQWEDKYDVAFTITKAVDYITSEWEEVNKRSSYLAALYLDSVPKSEVGSPSFETTLITYLQEEVQPSSDGYYWSYATGGWWRALGGDIEVTALALKALVENDPSVSMPVIRGAVQWLLQRQSSYGWGNTADTMAAISTIIYLNQRGFSSDEDAEVTLTLNDEVIGEYNLSLSSVPTLYLDLREYLVLGENNFQLTKSGLGNVSFYFQGNQILRSLPTITLPTEINAAPDQQVTLPITFTPTSSLVFASNITASPLAGEIIPDIDLPLTIDQLTQQVTIGFNYTAPSNIGTYEIPGIEISFILSNGEQTQFSPGIVSRVYGPVQLEVSNKVEISVVINSEASKLIDTKVEKLMAKSNSASGLELTRTYSQFDSFQPGELIYVTLTITNTESIENYIMLEDYIPIGFELDETTLESYSETYELTPSGITFFFPKLELGETEVQYGLVAMSVRQSLVSPAKVSCMYDEWVVASSSAILGDIRIPIDPATGAVVQDLQLPILEETILEETLIGSSCVQNITVTVCDNWGISSVRVFVKQSSWNMWNLYQTNGLWKIIASGLNEGESQIYVEVIDYAGNVLVCEAFSYDIEVTEPPETTEPTTPIQPTLPNEPHFQFFEHKIPILPIFGLIAVAMLVGIGSSIFLRRKQL